MAGATGDVTQATAATTDAGPGVTRTSSKTLKSKFVFFYEVILEGQDLSAQPHIWEELFLLKVDAKYLESQLQRADEAKLRTIQPNLAALSQACVQQLTHELRVRRLHALQTLALLAHQLLRKWPDDWAAVAQTLGFDVTSFSAVVGKATQCVAGGDGEIKQAGMELLLALAGGTALLANKFADAFFESNIFDTILQVINQADYSAFPSGDQPVGTRVRLGDDNRQALQPRVVATTLLALLTSHRKFELLDHPYLTKLNYLQSEYTLRAFADVLTDSLARFNQQFLEAISDSPGIVSRVFGFVRRTAHTPPSVSLHGLGVILSLLYQLVHSNAYFVPYLGTTLSLVNPEAPKAPHGTGSAGSTTSSPPASPPFSPTSPTSPQESVPAPEATAGPSVHFCPRLVAELLTFSSILFQAPANQLSQTAVEERAPYLRLLLLIWRCLLECPPFSALMHDETVWNHCQWLHKTGPNKYDCIGLADQEAPVHGVYEVLLIFLTHNHTARVFPVDVYEKCLDVIEVMMLYSKEKGLEASARWSALWAALLRFAEMADRVPETAHGRRLLVKVVWLIGFVLQRGRKVVSLEQYEQLLYEVVRKREAINRLKKWADQQFPGDEELRTAFVPILASLAALSPGIAALPAPPSSDQVLLVIRRHCEHLPEPPVGGILLGRYRETPQSQPLFQDILAIVRREALSHAPLVVHSKEEEKAH